MNTTDLTGLGGCGTGEHGKVCELHFLVANEMAYANKRMEKLEEKTDDSLQELGKSLNDLTLQVNTFVGTQTYREKSQDEMDKATLKNTTDIGELKSSLKSVENQNGSILASVDKLEKTMSRMSTDIKEIDKTMLEKDDVTEIVKNTIMAEKNIDQGKWFESLPAKVSAGVAVLSFISFFTIKIVVMLLAL